MWKFIRKLILEEEKMFFIQLIDWENMCDIKIISDGEEEGSKKWQIVVKAVGILVCPTKISENTFWK